MSLVPKDLYDSDGTGLAIIDDQRHVMDETARIIKNITGTRNRRED
jgi:hypothetical protein